MSPLPPDFWTTLPLARGAQLLTRDGNGLAAIDKPAGVLSHPNETGDEGRSLLHARYEEARECFVWPVPGEGGERRLWLLNRLDSATSGVILVAASEALARAVKDQFARKQVRKIYQALVFGAPATGVALWRDLLAVHKSGGRIRTHTRGNVPALTQFRLVRRSQGAFPLSLIQLEPRTGRSHQLRVQCAKRGLPIVGDQTYGDFPANREFARATGIKRMFLHSLETGFTYEFRSRQWNFRATAPLPGEFNAHF
ncbi:MAG: RNA pseudouridine synthase [Opitutaceae bacterium]|nr:RNA pseudouridine synthase [Opitutaceae bacterium]